MADRDANGRFVKGHGSPGPGRPPRAIEEKVLAAIVKAFASNGELDANLIEPWKKETKKGNSELIKLALAYLIGSPEQVLRLRGDGANGEIVIDLVRTVIGTEDTIAGEVASAAGEDPG